MSSSLALADETTPRGRILVVEDDRDTRALLRRWLEDDGYLIDESSTAEDALRVAEAGGHALAMVDVMLPGLGGVELAPKLSIPVLLMSVTEFEDLPEDTPIAGFLSKPFSRAGLKRAVQQAMTPR
ncbi:hypothetical protein BH10ACT11_BH10ACT11_00350 [soil metagenome]